MISDGSIQEGQTTYLCSNSTFPHELGHNMGSLHDVGTITQGGTEPLGRAGIAAPFSPTNGSLTSAITVARGTSAAQGTVTDTTTLVITAARHAPAPLRAR